MSDQQPIIPGLEATPPPPIGDEIFRMRRIDGKLYLAPRGNLKGRLMLILSHPNFEDLQNGNLLSGAYRPEVFNAAEAAGIREEDLYITSMVKCGIGGKSKPSNDLITEHAPILDYEIARVKPKLIMTLGAEVFKRVMKANVKQGSAFGEIVDCPYGKVIPNYSPGMILNQDPKQRPKFREVFEYARRFLDDQLHYTPFDYMLVNDVPTARFVVNHYVEKGALDVGYDLEWKGTKFTDDEVVYTIQFSCEPNRAIVFSISEDGKTENLELLQTLKPLLEHPNARRLGWNIRADDKRLSLRGFKLPDNTLGFDGMKACAFFDSRWSKGLETGINKFTNYEHYYVPLDEALKKHKLDKANLAELKFLEPDLFYRYCAGDAVSHRTACLNMMKYMEKLPERQKRYYYDVYLPLSAYFLDLELTGLPIDQNVLEDLTVKYTTVYQRIFDELQVYTKKLGFDTEKFNAAVAQLKDKKDVKAPVDGYYEDFNPASAPQKKILLFEILNLSPAYYTKGKSPKPRAWYLKAKPVVQAQCSPSTNGKSLATLKFELTEQLEQHKKTGQFIDPKVPESFEIVKRLLDLSRVGVFANKFLNKQGTEFVNYEEEDEDDGEEGLKSSYWNAICKDGHIHADFFECLANFRSSSRPNVQNPASKVLSHIPNIFVPGYSQMPKDEKKKHEAVIPRNIRHAFWSGHQDWHFVEVDVAGADLMIGAYLSKDPKYINDMLKGNFHLKKAREYFRDPNISKDDYSKYVSAKAITFRVAYTAELLQAALPIQAEIYAESGILLPLDTIIYALETWKGYEKYMEFRERCKAQVDLGYIENYRGIRYHFEDTENFGIIAGWKNESLAYPIASELALFLWEVSVKIKQYLMKQGVWMNWCKPVNSVHDASYWIVHKDLMKDNFFPEVCRNFFTKECKIATGDNLGMEMVAADRWKSKDEVFHKETTWNFEQKCWDWKT